MVTSTKTRRKPWVKIDLREFAETTSPLKVDREKGIIFGVKILGWESDNKRKYLPEAVNAALHLYEGAKVFTNHPATGDKSARDDGDAFGKLRNVRSAPNGPEGDLHFFTTHPLAKTICEDVERGMGVFGLSHNAVGEGEWKDGIFIVHRITEVRSVDLVSESATTKTLWEHVMPKPQKLKAALTEAAKKWDFKLFPKVKTRLVKLIEEYGDMEAEGEEGGDYKAQLRATVNAVLADDSLDPDAKLSKIKALCKMHEEENVPEEEEEPDKKEPEKKDEEKDKLKEGEGDDEKDKEKEKATEARVRQLENKDKARTLLESAGLTHLLAGGEGATLLEALTRCESETQMKAMIDREKKLRGRSVVKSQGAGPVQERGRAVPLQEASTKEVGQFLRSSAWN